MDIHRIMLHIYRKPCIRCSAEKMRKQNCCWTPYVCSSFSFALRKKEVMVLYGSLTLFSKPLSVLCTPCHFSYYSSSSLLQSWAGAVMLQSMLLLTSEQPRRTAVSQGGEKYFVGPSCTGCVLLMGRDQFWKPFDCLWQSPISHWEMCSPHLKLKHG